MSNWISIEDELPPYNIGFLFHVNESFEGQKIFTGIRFPSKVDIVVKEPISGMTFTRYMITHWMPLPKPPSNE